MKAYKTFDEWWNSSDNPAKNMPSTTKAQMEWHMRQAWSAGKHSKVFRKAPAIEVENA